MNSLADVVFDELSDSLLDLEDLDLDMSDDDLVQEIALWDDDEILDFIEEIESPEELEDFLSIFDGTVSMEDVEEAQRPTPGRRRRIVRGGKVIVRITKRLKANTRRKLKVAAKRNARLRRGRKLKARTKARIKKSLRIRKQRIRGTRQ